MEEQIQKIIQEKEEIIQGKIIKRDKLEEEIELKNNKKKNLTKEINEGKRTLEMLKKNLEKINEII